MTMGDPVKVVMVSPSLPEAVPEHAGGRLVADIVRELLPLAEVSVVVPDGPAVQRAEPLPELHRVVRVVPDPDARSLPFSSEFERFIATGLPPRWFQRALANHSEALSLLRSADIIDLQWQEQAGLIPWLREVNPRARITVTLHDVVSQRESRALDASQGPGVRSLAARARWAWARRRAVTAEARLTGARTSHAGADAVAVLSDKDAALLPAGSALVTVVSPPLAEAYAHVDRAPQPGCANLLMVAYLARWANEEGLKWFAERVLPLIRSAVPDVTLRVAGTGIRPTTVELARAHDFELLGFVPELDDLYRTSHVAVVPLLQGAGVKFKVVDAICAGTPVVTTTVGAEGIGERRWFAGVSDDPRKFADAVITVLRDQDTAEQRAQLARDQLRTSFGREAFQKALSQVYGLDIAKTSDVQRPEVSVVIPAYNASQVIERQLTALAQQIDAPPFEVIVANNRSTDSTRAVAEQWKDRFPSGLRVISAHGAQGVSHARNAGIASAHADKVLICDADDAVAPNWVAAMSAALDESELVGSSLLRAKSCEPEQDLPMSEPLQSIFGYLPYVVGCALGVRKSVWTAVRGFDEAFPAGHEEVDFCWRVQEAGYPIRGVPETHVEYIQRDTARGVIRQYRNYAQGAMLLWTRFADHAPMPPVSFVGSVRGAAQRTLKSWPLLVRRGNLQMARDLGWSWGTVLGHLKYRKVGTPPVPRLWRPE